jgi:hypothetical protein
MKIKHGRTEPQLLKNPHGQYELIGGTEEDLEAAKHRVKFRYLYQFRNWLKTFF